MSAILNKSEIEILISFVRDYSKDAYLLAEKAFNALKSGDYQFKSDQDRTLPELPEHLTKNDKNITFNTNAIIDFFVAVYHLPKGLIENSIDKFDQINALNFGNDYKIKVSHVVEYFILLLVELRGKSVLEILSESKNDFWTNYHAFINVFSVLTISVDPFCEVLKLISLKTEGDMAAGSIYNLLRQIPDLDLTFANSLNEKLLLPENKTIAKYIGVLTEGLMKYTSIQWFEDTVLNLLKGNDVENITTALNIASNLNFVGQSEVAQNIFKVIAPLLSDTRDQIRFSTTIAIISLSKELEEARRILLELSLMEDVQFRFPISEYLWRSTSEYVDLSYTLRQISMNLASYKCDNHRMMNHINWHIKDCFKAGEKQYAATLFETWLKNGQVIKSLEDVTTYVASKDFPWLCSIITPWFVSSNRFLIEALMEITAKHDKRTFELDVNLVNGFTEKEMSKLIGSIIGFIYMKEPLASLTLSILDSAHLERQAINVETLFVDYICYTYPSTLKEYIQPAIKNSTGLKKKILQNIKKRVDKYWADLKSLPQLKELQGSDNRKRSNNKAFSSQRDKSMNASRNNSIFGQFATNITMRAGATWFSKTEEGYSNESKLQPMEFSFEMPRAEYIDPATFEIFRTRMRYEALKI